MPGVTITTEHAQPTAATTQSADTTTSGAGPAPQPAPASAPAPKVVTVERSRVFRPRRLRSAQDIDEYLEAARKQLLDALKDNDSVKLN